MAEPLLQLRRVVAFYGQAQALFGIDLEVYPGEVVALLGRNGAGKSTTIKTVMNLIPQSGGERRFAGRDITRLPPHHIARLGVGYVPEERRIFTELTVLENLAVGQRAAPPHRPAWTKDRLFELFPNLEPLAHRLGGRMSGGEQQMLAVARTLMGQPQLVLLDEPSEGLAPKIVDQMARSIQALKASHLAVLLSEQNLHFARALADRVYLIDQGEIKHQGDAPGLLADTDAVRRYLAV